MAYNRAFSDAEIVTIAAVAAAALGGIVVGLGRGQANVAQSPSGPERLRELSASRLSGALEALPPREELAMRAHHFQEQAARRLPEVSDVDGQALREALASLAENVKHSDLAHEFTRMIEQFTERDAGPSAVRAGKRGLRPFSDHGHRRGQAANLASQAGATLAAARQAMPGRKRGQRESPLAGAAETAGAARERLEAVVERVGEHLPSKEQGSDARQRTAEALERRVTEPVSRAAGTTKDTTQEALTAALWLTAGAGLVYFGLLSSERREQVKNFICGAYEQARLLALDFQGYEAEM